MPRQLEEILSELYLSNIDIIGDGLPAWVNSMRSSALEAFNLSGLPDSHNEDYRHTDLSKIFEGDWETYFIPSLHKPGVDRIVQAEDHTVDVYNGFCTEDGLVTLHNGVVYGSLREAMNTMPEVVSKYYNSGVAWEKNSAAALNTVFTQDGAFIYVPAGVEVTLPFSLGFTYDSEEQAQMCFSRALIIVEKGAQADLVISHTSGEGKILADHVREIYVAENAKLRLTEVASLGSRTAMVSYNGLCQEAGSNADMVSLWLRGGLVRLSAVTDLAGKECESMLNGLYFAGASERVDINMTVNHLVPDCRSSELIKGVVSGEAVGAFTGKVFVAPDAQHTEAFQQNRNLQLSDGARIYTEPQLEIYADDVKCSHGATVGQMDQEAVYYMRQRGISEDDAKRLQLFGFVNDVIAKCHGEGVCEILAQLAQRRIEEM